MVSLTFYGGANEIGGNKILLEDKDARVYLDFEESFDFGEDYFYQYLQPRTAHFMHLDQPYLHPMFNDSLFVAFLNSYF